MAASVDGSGSHSILKFRSFAAFHVLSGLALGKESDTMKVQTCASALTSADRFNKQITLDSDLLSALQWTSARHMEQVPSISRRHDVSLPHCVVLFCRL